MVKSLLPGMEEIIHNFFIEIDFTTNRNLEKFNFTSKIKRNERKNIIEIMTKNIRKIESEIFSATGQFLKLKNDSDFINDDKILKSANVYRDWPYDRLIYINDDFICLINEEDHLKLKINSKNSEKMTNLMQNYFEFLEKIESQVDFVLHEKFGFLNTLPANVGTATYFTIKMKITQDLGKHEELLKKFEESKKDLNIEIKKNQNEEFYLELNNLNPFYTFTTLLIELINIKDYLK